MKAKDIILKAFERAKRERGLRIITSSANLSDGHIKKTDHNLIVMTDLNKLGHEDWVVIVAYYAMCSKIEDFWHAKNCEAIF